MKKEHHNIKCLRPSDRCKGCPAYMPRVMKCMVVETLNTKLNIFRAEDDIYLHRVINP